MTLFPWFQLQEGEPARVRYSAFSRFFFFLSFQLISTAIGDKYISCTVDAGNLQHWAMVL